MHEVSVIQNLLEHIERYGAEYGLARVTRVVVRIGDEVCLNLESLRFAFEAVSRGTIAEGAELALESVSGRELDLQTIEGEQEETPGEN